MIVTLLTLTLLSSSEPTPAPLEAVSPPVTAAASRTNPRRSTGALVGSLVGVLPVIGCEWFAFHSALRGGGSRAGETARLGAMLVPLALVGPALGAWLSGDPTTWSRRVGASLLPLLGGALGFAAGVGFGLLVGGIGGLAAWGNLYGLVFGAAAGLQFSSFLCLPLALAGAIAGSVTASALIGSAPGVSETTEAQPSPTTPTLTVSPSRDGVSVGLQLRW